MVADSNQPTRSYQVFGLKSGTYDMDKIRENAVHRYAGFLSVEKKPIPLNPSLCSNVRRRISDEHFTVDGTLLEAWASVKNYQPKDQKGSAPPDNPGNPTVNFHGEKRSNETHESKNGSRCADGAQSCRQGGQVEGYSGNLFMENRHGLIVSSLIWEATGLAERDAAMAMLQQDSGKRARDRGRRQGILNRSLPRRRVAIPNEPVPTPEPQR